MSIDPPALYPRAVVTGDSNTGDWNTPALYPRAVVQ